jgi:hypothetical protein
MVRIESGSDDPEGLDLLRELGRGPAGQYVSC